MKRFSFSGGVFLALCFLNFAATESPNGSPQQQAAALTPEDNSKEKVNESISFREVASSGGGAAVVDQIEEASAGDDAGGDASGKIRGKGANYGGPDTPDEETRLKYEKVLEELEQDPRYKAARDRNNKDAVSRAERIRQWLRDHPNAQATGRRPVLQRNRQWDEVVGELEKNERFKKAGERLGARGRATGSSSLEVEAKAHDFMGKREKEKEE